MRTKFQIIGVTDNGKKYFIIKTKKGWFGRWKTFMSGKWVYSEFNGWRETPMMFKTAEKAEDYLRDKMMKHDISEYVVKEFAPPSIIPSFIKKDKNRDNYINELNNTLVRHNSL